MTHTHFQVDADRNSFPLPPGDDTYTIPTVRLPDGKYIMDSMAIAKHIEAKHPTPSIHLDSPYVTKVQELLGELMQLGTGLRGVFLPLIPERLLNQVSVDYWMESRAKKLGKPVEALTADERGGKAWEYATKPMQEVTKLLKENDGPFFTGDTVCYADLIWAGFLLFFQRQGDDLFQKVISISGDVEGQDNVHVKLLEAVKPWSARDDH